MRVPLFIIIFEYLQPNRKLMRIFFRFSFICVITKLGPSPILFGNPHNYSVFLLLCNDGKDDLTSEIKNYRCKYLQKKLHLALFTRRSGTLCLE